jgi:hypothetical protein
MALTLEDLDDLTNNHRDPIRVGAIPMEVAKFLSLKNHNVYLSRYSLIHILKDHPDIDHFALLNLPFAIERGLLVQERAKPHIILSSFLDTANRIRFISAMKIAQQGTEIWLSSFYRSSGRQTKSILRRGVILQNHK